MNSFAIKFVLAGWLSAVGFSAMAQSQPAFRGPPPVAGLVSDAPAAKLADMPLHPAEASGQVMRRNYTAPNGDWVHLSLSKEAETARLAAGLAAPTGPLIYRGGQIMQPFVSVYLIFWSPPTLQNGAATPAWSQLYGTLAVLTAAWLPGHNPFTMVTQYYQNINNTLTFVNNGGGLGGYYIDTRAYPAAGCTDTATPGNCVSDAQMQAEIESVMALNGWTGGVNKIFVLLTSPGMGSCSANAGGCYGPGGYCAYHGSTTFNGQSLIYAIIPYLQTNCQHGPSLPNNDFGDVAADSMSHEITEAATDPLGGTGWVAADGSEIGDICNGFQNAPNTWGYNGQTSNTATQMWNGWLFEVQGEYNNHIGGCSSTGP